MRPGRRFGWLTLGAVSAVAAVTLAFACLPDLEATPTPRTVPTGVCGDGVIDPDAGEECDPGVVDGSVPGCSSGCKIVCGVHGSASYLEPSSNHCYFLLSPEAGPYQPDGGCLRERAHVVTLGSIVEAQDVGNGLRGRLQDAAAGAIDFWLGYRQVASDASFDETPYLAVVDEPGFFLRPKACPGCCTGCFVSQEVALPPKGAAGDYTCLTWSVDTEKWSATDCAARYPTICEREPAGSRRFDCDGLQCFDIQTEAVAHLARSYAWIPGETMAAADAAQFCADLAGPNQSASLVVFESDEQREQLFYELMHLPVPADAGRPTSFWVALTSSRSDGGKLVWSWANGNQSEADWGDHEPKATLPGVRGYAEQSARGYESPPAAYDTQLVHAHNPVDGGTQERGVLCQLQSMK